ncbi:MAG: exodeoxyribonuclease VII small subunit [Gammaproteobacteria bacterium]|nr:exodeoxyribonuclease VII small subunit [Gammaproteobacteria bacterium]
MPRKVNTYHYEKSLAELTTVVEKLETGDLSLEDALKQFELGIKLTRSCQKALNNAEQQVQILLKNDEHAELNNIDNDKS